MNLVRESPCKVNLLLNILGRRPDGFHELESVMHPVRVHDVLSFEQKAGALKLTCSDPALPTDSLNLVYRAADRFLAAAKVTGGVCIHLEKRIPLAAGLGGGSGNAATTLKGLNELFGHPLNPAQLHDIAASLGSDIPFFLQTGPALASGRGEIIQPLPAFQALRGAAFLLVHPGFGISTAWAYQQLSRIPAALNGRRGRADELVKLLNQSSLWEAGKEFHNSLEAPALEKFPVLMLYQEFLREHGALATLMSGSGSTTFALFPNLQAAERVTPDFERQFGGQCWIRAVPVE